MRRQRLQLPVDRNVDLDEMDFSEDTDEYTESCRCGGLFIVTSQDILEQVERVCCTNCSLMIQINY